MALNSFHTNGTVPYKTILNLIVVYDIKFSVIRPIFLIEGASILLYNVRLCLKFHFFNKLVFTAINWYIVVGDGDLCA